MEMKPLQNLLTLCLAFLSIQAFAQISHEGVPSNWNEKELSRLNVEFVQTDLLDLELLQAEDAVTDEYKEVPYRFGQEWEVAFNLENSGTWTTLGNGDRQWTLGIECLDATSISFILDQFKLPKTAQFFVWNDDRTEYLGSFNHTNNKDWGSFAIGLVHDDKVVLELIEPAGVAGESIVQVGTIVHGYRSIVRRAEQAYEDANRGPFGNSGNCNINVNCPEGDPWQVEKRGVALIVNGGSAVCSGTLVNNTAQDGTPYFLTANHCLGGQNNWIFYFNHETAGCTGNTGPTNQSISGSILRASNGGSDVALLELSDTPPTNFNVQYCGWDNSDDLTVTETTCIHHPSGDLKKICFDNDPPYHASQGGAAVWYIDEWELGVTEPGSSGSALFDQEHRIIGQLYGGIAACSGNVNNGQPDWYGRFGVSWDGNSASSRLRDWLDPLNTAQTILDGYPEGFVTYDNDAGLGGFTNVEAIVCGSVIFPVFNLTNFGTQPLTSVTINYYVNGALLISYDWNGNLEQGQGEELTLPLTNLQDGDNEIEVILTNPNGIPDDNEANNSTSVEFTAFAGPTYEYSMTLLTDEFGDETTWEIQNESNVTIYQGGPYEADTEIVETFCLSDGCYTFTIFDSFGDGICCGWGDGSYQLYTHLGFNFASGGEFEDSEEVEFCTDDLSVNDQTNVQRLIVYPNPTDGNVTVQLPLNAEKMTVTNALGQITLTQSLGASSSSVQLDLSALPAGWYQVTVQTNKTTTTGRIMVK